MESFSQNKTPATFPRQLLTTYMGHVCILKFAAIFFIVDDYFLSSEIRKISHLLSGVWAYGRSI